MGGSAGAADSRGSRGIIAEESELYCRFERRGDDSDDGWDNYSEGEEDAAVQGVSAVRQRIVGGTERVCGYFFTP